MLPEVVVLEVAAQDLKPVVMPVAERLTPEVAAAAGEVRAPLAVLVVPVL
jgi:hypothetical protein